MHGSPFFLFGLLAKSCLLVGWFAQGVGAEGPVRFNRDIRPILSNYCFECHGPDENNREAGLRLDQREAAIELADSGLAAIVPGNSEESELVRRIFSEDSDEVMPPADHRKHLSPAHQALLRRWVDEGAIYEQHWSFTKLEYPPLPEVKNRVWVRNAIDSFVLARLEAEDLQPSPAADWPTIFRRLSLDLTGLPPVPEEGAAFRREIAAAEASDAKSLATGERQSRDEQSTVDRVYGEWVDRLLASPHYGERMAIDWLDAARFADTNGYQVDRDREMYAWRDWVINAFNANQPFDQFTIEQLAGDLLPNATLDQRIATGFHRNHLMNEEGGIIPEEFLAEYCSDRVETTATVWLGQTFNCCRCHDHKFDPFTQQDYYSLYAFFHNITEKGIGDYSANIRHNAPPILKLPAPEIEAKLASLKKQQTEVENSLAARNKALAADQADWEARLHAATVKWTSAQPTSIHLDKLDASPDTKTGVVNVPSLKAGKHTIVVELTADTPHVTALLLQAELSAVDDPARFTDTPKLEISNFHISSGGDESGEEPAVNLWPLELDGSLAASELMNALDGNEKTAVDFALNRETPQSLAVELEPALSKLADGLRIEISFKLKAEMPPWELNIQTTAASADLLASASLLEVARKTPDERTVEETKQLAEFRQARDPESRAFAKQVETLKQQISKTDLEIPTTLVMEEMSQPRPTFILIRGAYNQKGDRVSAATPAALPSMSVELPRNRLGLARWLVDPTNPLTARVTVNRFWQALFGTGIVQTAEDFGMQGEMPSHPDLLDWLATEFIRSGWDIKATMRLLVTSSTYRQSSRLNSELGERDPKNRLLARGPRFRLQAEFLRDQALAASGLLITKIGGPSVRPYHPPGLYEQVVSGSSSNTYVLGKGDELYRRSLYTYWKRSVPNPAMLVFDAPFRELCAVRRSRTNTPLQALNLMNDPTYVEAARCLAQRMIAEGGDSITTQITQGYELLLGRVPSTEELHVLTAAYQRTVSEFQQDQDGAKELLAIGDSSADDSIDVAQLAAMTTIASTILNFDETVMKE